MLNMKYAGIGSRETPDDVLNVMTKLAKRLCELGFTLSSGGAKGADSAFEAGVYDDKVVVYRPNGKIAKPSKRIIPYSKEAVEMGEALFRKHHPNPNACNQWAKELHVRNAFILLGDLSPQESQVDFVVCWTKDGGPTGGTGQALRIAASLNLPVFNLYYPVALDNLRLWLMEYQVEGVQ